MKKVLFATTALVMSAGFAVAEVEVVGDGRMGVFNDGNDTNFTSRARVRFNLSGETDTGLSFGGTFRVDHQDGDDEDRASEGAAGTVFVSGAYGQLTMGDIDSASENANGDLDALSLTGLGDSNEFGYIASGAEYNGNPGALYQYSFGSATVYASMYDGSPEFAAAVAADPTATPPVEGSAQVGALDGDAWSIGGNYDTGTFNVGLGYEDSDDSDVSRWTLSGGGTFSGFTVKAIYAAQDNGQAAAADVDEYGLSGMYTLSSVEVAGYWKRVDSSAANVDEVDHFGLGAAYDLGGGASLRGGIADSNAPNSDARVDMGVAFSF